MSWKYFRRPGSGARADKQAEKTRWYGIVRAPHVTEKSTRMSAANQVTFTVAADADKADIRAAVEGLFDVKVVAVNTVNIAGKVKRFRGRLGRRVGVRKAIVTLAAGDSIDLGATL